MLCTQKRGDFIIGMVLATVLFMFMMKGLFEAKFQNQEQVEERYAIEELAMVGKAVDTYLSKNKQTLLNLAAFNRAEGASQAVLLGNSSDAIVSEIDRYLPNNQSLRTMRNIWGDSFNVVFIRTPNAAAENASDTNSDVISCYVVTSGNAYQAKHRSGTETGDRWLGTGMRRAVMRGGAAYGFVEEEGGVLTLKSGGWSTTAGLNLAGAHEGDLAYLAGFNIESMADRTLSRYMTGDNADNTLFADIDMNDNNLLNVRYLEAQAISTGSVRFDNTLYDDAAEAEASCQQNWFYIKDKTTKGQVNADGQAQRLFVDQYGNVYSSWTATNGVYQGVASSFVGTLGMNGGLIATRVMNDGSQGRFVSNVGRMYYVSPSQATIPGGGTKYDANRQASNEVFASRSQLAVCRVINGENTLAYIGDNRTEDKIAFVVSAVDGDFIPPFFCPGQDANVAGGGTTSLSYNVNHVNSSGGFSSSTSPESLFSSGRNTDNAKNTAGIMPRLFVMPQMVSTGKSAFPIQGIKAWAETVDTSGAINKGWIIRLNALIDTQKGTSTARTYWIGTVPKDKQIQHSGITISGEAEANKPGYMSTQELEQYINGGSPSLSIDYLRAVVIGVCSGKVNAF